MLGREKSRAEAQRWMQGRELGSGARGLRWPGGWGMDQGCFLADLRECRS